VSFSELSLLLELLLADALLLVLLLAELAPCGRVPFCSCGPAAPAAEELAADELSEVLARSGAPFAQLL
jgi:hypothetical protein